MNTFAALADLTRCRIFELLAQGEMSVGEIVGKFQFKAPTISQHLKVLKQAKLVRVRVLRQQRIYAVDEEGFKELERWVEQQREHWSTKLDALERHLDAKVTNNKSTSK